MNISVYCGASLGNNDLYEEAAKSLGKWIAEIHDLKGSNILKPDSNKVVK
ncbi:hypothetical protein LZ480_06945 [Solibacillus sp. MA9]|uniref:Uncharacterized protein n=1 Tax=Solibacillus palustris TaxID=2908203 RepID=A0ABS9UBC2_9BACL|nr:hypothetical protein [Solibacillus sp. MA9]MCH7321629.1 hypothetical protein [Solibacillus sp. MA9]